MPYTPTSPTLTLCDALVTYLTAQWGPKAPSEVRREYIRRVDFSTVKGRLVLIFPAGYTNVPAERGNDFYTHSVQVAVFERYTDAADDTVTVPKEWVDERVDFVNTFIAEGFDFTHDTTYGGLAPFNRNLQTLSTDVPEICDTESLNQKEFWCEVTCVFQELMI
jgi:hypothetical protein